MACEKNCVQEFFFMHSPPENIEGEAQGLEYLSFWLEECISAGSAEQFMERDSHYLVMHGTGRDLPVYY